MGKKGLHKKISVFLLPISLIVFVASCASNNPSSPWVAKTSIAGADWAEATASAAFPVRYGHTNLVYNNEMWVIAGFNYNDVWNSADGTNWIKATGSAAFKGREYHSSAVYDNKMWVIAGAYLIPSSSVFLSDVWYSTDGADWYEATGNAAFGQRDSHTSLVYNNAIWVIGGYDGSNLRNDVWYSTDGANWVTATGDAAFSARYGHTSVVYNNEMWVIAGTLMNDVWYSSDGANWTEATGNADFQGRQNHVSMVYCNKMWVIGGENPDNFGTLMNDVWFSGDGANWTEAIANAAFSARWNHAGAVFNNKIWLTAGNSKIGIVDDVWHSPY